MNSYVDFKPQDAVLPGYIRFSITKKAFGSMSSKMEETLAMLTSFSRSRVLLVTPAKDAGLYEVYTSLGSYLCTPTDDGSAMLIIGYSKNSLMRQNNAMKNGICFKTSEGVIVQIKLTDPYEIYFDICNGTRLETNGCEHLDAEPAVRLIKEQVAKSQGREPEDEKEEYQPEKKFANLLQTAESYAILSSELEEKHANMLGNIPYTYIEAAEYDRIDRVAYEFGVRKLDENTFKAGVQVEVEDKKQEKHSAEIIRLVKEDADSPATAVVLLFNEHIDITEFNSSGWFNLSFSTVNRDVQLAAIDKLRAGEAAAKYMDQVFGKSASAGFENKNLSQVKEKLLQKKYPPNESQMNAIFSGINSRDVFLVMGPPGTGKTTVILEWVKYFVTKEHKRVLVSSQNNKAVDNVLARIADEKDIDIIRIGSESKLQSEVVPYMFENKVKTLRESIASNSERKIGDIDRIVKIWRYYQKNLEKAEPFMKRLEASEKQFRLSVSQEFIPLYNQLQAVYREYKEVSRKRHMSAAIVKNLEDRVKRLGGDGAGGLKAETLRFQELKSRETLLVTRYNSLRSRYQREYELVRDVDFFNVYMDRKEAGNVLKKLPWKPAKYPENIWGLFDEARSFEIRCSEDCGTMKALIKKNMDRAAKIQSLLMLWEEESKSQQNYALNEIVLESVDLVGATCIGINSQKRFANLDFDVTIMDEAGQIQVHNALVPMSVSNQLIMLGDHRQIPPSADQELVDLCEENGVKHDLLEKSLFEKMYYDLPEANKMMLDTQYRMPGEIADTISEWFYEGKYYSPAFKRGLKSQIPALFQKPYVIIDTSGESGRFEKKIPGAGSSNELEAQIVAHLIKFLSDNPENDLKEMGVISAYKSQVRLIKNKLSAFLPKEVVNEMAATLDSYQGQERDIILYSFTKSSAASPDTRRIGFLNELRRLNVAMTRCKKMLVLIGDMKFLGGCRHCDKSETGEEIYEKSERQFSDFINKMVADVKKGRGEFVSCREFFMRLKAGDR